MDERRWPADWEARMAGKECPLCTAIGRGDNDFSLHICDGAFSEVRLERRSQLPGYCIVVWKGRHVAEPTDLQPTEAAGYWQDVLEAGRAVQRQFNPIKLNYLTLGNGVPHLHTHVLPRYLDDPAPGGPIPWEAIFRPEPVPEAELRQQATDLRHLLGRRSSSV
jgi:diadenosine tetraphosphate (Ap4A) HIT family hydrolase